MSKKASTSTGRYVSITGAALITPPEARSREEARLVEIVESSPSFTSIFGNPVRSRTRMGKKMVRKS